MMQESLVGAATALQATVRTLSFLIAVGDHWRISTRGVIQFDLMV